MDTHSAGGLYIFSSNGKSGKKISMKMSSRAAEPYTKLRIYFFASSGRWAPIHWPTQVITAMPMALVGIYRSPDREPAMALEVILVMPRLTIKVWVRIFPPLKKICSRAAGMPIYRILFWIRRLSFRMWESFMPKSRRSTKTYRSASMLKMPRARFREITSPKTPICSQLMKTTLNSKYTTFIMTERTMAALVSPEPRRAPVTAW